MNKCCEDKKNHCATRFKDACIVCEGYPYTVYFTYCEKCGQVIKGSDWVE